MSRSMRLHFINHACVLIEAGHTRLLCDPWLSGSAFHNGLKLLAPGSPTCVDLQPSHLWISHEHPDHFSPRDLLTIPPSDRGRVLAYYQKTSDRKVTQFLSANGFPVCEMGDDAVSLESDVSVRCGSVGSDSWLLVESGGSTILNMNDCLTLDPHVLDQPRTKIGNVDVLLTQFSYANWVGNPEDVDLQRWAASMWLDQIRGQIAAFRPRYVVPFASFVWFCHDENAYMNQHMNRVRDIVPVIRECGAEPVVMFPGDAWRIGAAHDTEAACVRWDGAYADVATRGREHASSVTFRKLEASFEAYVARLRRKNDWRALEDFAVRGNLPATTIYLWDYGSCVSFDILNGLREVGSTTGGWDVAMHSESLLNVLQNEWGRGTLTVNGRFHVNYRTVGRFWRQTQIAYANNVGLRFPDTLSPEALLAPARSLAARIAAMKAS